MNTTLLRAGALACALLTTTSLTAPALAQDAPPVRHNVDRNGVDLLLGTFELSQSLLSIGPEQPHGLRYVRSRNGNRWVDNFTGAIVQEASQVFVSVGNTSARFTYSGGSNLTNSGSFSTDLGDGATLTRSGGTFTFTNASGIVVHLTASITSGQIVAGSSRLVDIVHPGGAKLTFYYRTQSYCDGQGQNCVSETRLQSVINNFNYQMRFGYSQDSLADAEDVEAWHSIASVRAINTAVESCDPSVLSCSLTGAWPTVTFAYSGTQETVTLPDGHAWLITGSVPSGLADGGQITAIRRPGATSDDVAVTYDGEAVDTVTNATGTYSYSFVYSAPNEITTVTGPSSTVRTTISDPDALVVLSQEDELGNETSYQYDSLHRVTRITAPEGNYTAFTYDGRGNVTEVRRVAKSGSGLADIVTSATYPCTNAVTCNLPTAVTDARGNVTDFTWDSTHGGLLTATAPAPTTGAVRPQTRITYSSASVGGQTVYRPTAISACQTGSSCSGAADEALTTIAYSGANDLPSSIASGNGSGTLTATTAVAYDDIGNLATIDGPLSGSADTIRFRYNALRQRTGTISPDPDGTGSLKHRAVRTSYDDAGLPQAVETGTVNSQSDSDWAAMSVLEGVAIERDSFGRPIVQRLVSGSTTYALTQTSYDAFGRVRCIAQRMNGGQFATSALPTDNCTVDTAGSYGADRITRMSYDAAGQVTLVETGVDTGDEADEVTTTYTDNGRVETVTDGEGNRTTYEYDGFDRLRNTRFPSPTTDGVSAPTSGTGNDYEQLSYDAAGNVTARRLRDGATIGYGYDALGRLIAVDTPPSGSGSGSYGEYDRSYVYDNLSRPTQLNSASTLSITLGYDALGRQVSETSYAGAKTMQYDLAGRLTRLSWPDGLYIDYDRLVTGEVGAIRENGATSGAGVLASYAYDDRGRRTSLTRGNGTSTSYGYDNVSRLTQIVHNLAGTGSDLTLDFAYNPAGQIASNTRDNTAYSFTGHANLNRTDTVNGRNQITATGSTSVSHDARGNVSAVGSDWYAYTSENFPSATTSALTLPNPRLRPHQVYNTGTGGAVRFDYLGDQLIGEYDTGNAIVRRYVPGPGVDEPVVWYEGSGTSTRQWFHADERGSVIAVSDGSGNLVGSTPNRYDEYGVAQGTLTGRFGYTGQAWLPELGLYDYRARNYHPGLGRFMQTDPIGYGARMNLYAYVLNDPINRVDPSGLDEVPGGTVFGPSPGGTTTELSGLSDLPMFAQGGLEISPDLGPDIIVNGMRPIYMMQPTAPFPRPFGWLGPWGRALQIIVDTIVGYPLGDPPGRWDPPRPNPQASLQEAGNPDDADQPSDAELRPVPDNRANDVAREHGYRDAHDAKQGRGGGGVDIYRDREGRYWLWDGQRGSEKEPL